MNTYTWQFTALDVFPIYQGLVNAVHVVHWRLTGNDGSSHSAIAYGTQALGPIDIGNFIPFVSLTASQIQTWVEAQMGSVEIALQRSGLDVRIADQISPREKTMSPPW